MPAPTPIEHSALSSQKLSSADGAVNNAFFSIPIAAMLAGLGKKVGGPIETVLTLPQKVFDLRPVADSVHKESNTLTKQSMAHLSGAIGKNAEALKEWRKAVKYLQPEKLKSQSLRDIIAGTEKLHAGFAADAHPNQFMESANAINMAKLKTEFDGAIKAAQLEGNSSRWGFMRNRRLEGLKKAGEALDRYAGHVSELQNQVAQHAPKAVEGMKQAETIMRAEAGKLNAALAPASTWLGNVGGAIDSSLKGGLLRPLGWTNEKGKDFYSFARASLTSYMPGAKAANYVKSVPGTDLKTRLSALPGKVVGMSGSDMLHTGIYAASQGISAYRMAKTYTGNMRVLKDAIAGVTGQKVDNVSTWQALFGALPSESLRQARSQYVKTVIPATISNIAGMALTHVFMKPGSTITFSKSILLSFGVQGATSGIEYLVAPKINLLATYKMIHRAQEAGQDVPKAAYGALIVAARPRQLGHLELDDKALLMVADRYAAANLAPAEVLKQMDSGAFAAEYAQAKKTVLETAPAAAGQTARDANGRLPRQEHPIVGAHTGKLTQATPEMNLAAAR
jgi:hypothetical protein